MLNRNHKVKKHNKNLEIQMVLLIAIAIGYIGMFFLSTSSLNITLQQYLEKDMVAVIDLLSVSTFLLSAYVIYEYRKNPVQKGLVYAYLIVFVSLIIQGNYLAGGLMGFYLIKYVRIFKLKKVLEKLEKGKDKSVFSLSLIILLVSILIGYFRYFIL